MLSLHRYSGVLSNARLGNRQALCTLFMSGVRGIRSTIRYLRSRCIITPCQKVQKFGSRRPSLLAPSLLPSASLERERATHTVRLSLTVKSSLHILAHVGSDLLLMWCDDTIRDLTTLELPCIAHSQTTRAHRRHRWSDFWAWRNTTREASSPGAH